MQRFRSGLVFKVHRLLYHSIPCLRVRKKKKRYISEADEETVLQGYLTSKKTLTPLGPP